MIDAPPAVPIDLGDTPEVQVETHLPMEEREDGSLLIDLRPLALPPEDRDLHECLDPDPNPLSPYNIMVCAEIMHSQRIASTTELAAQRDDFASAIPRARLRISDSATGEVNAVSKAVVGHEAQAAMVHVKIAF